MFDTSLAGRIAVLQTKPKLIEENPKTYSTYYDGEYFVIRATRQALTCVKLADGYGAHTTKTFMAATCEVVDAYDDDEVISDWLSDLAHFAGALGREEKLQWVSSVYSGAASVVRQARRAFERRQELLRAEKQCDEKIGVRDEAGVRLYTYTGIFVVAGTLQGVQDAISGGRFSSSFLEFRDRDGEPVFVQPNSIHAFEPAAV